MSISDKPLPPITRQAQFWPQQVVYADKLGKRLTAIVELREYEHLLFRQIAALLEVTPSRACALYHQAKGLQRYHAAGFLNTPFYGLSDRARKALVGAQVNDMGHLRHLLAEQKIKLKEIRGVGRAGEAEILAWAGLPPRPNRRDHLAAEPVPNPSETQACA